MEDRMSNHISKITFGFLTLINLLLFIIYGELKLMHAAIFSGTLIWLHFCITTFFCGTGSGGDGAHCKALAALRPGQQPVDVGVLARKGARIRHMLGIPLQPQARGGRRDLPAIQRRQRGIHHQRPGLAGLVLDGGQRLAVRAQQLQGGEVAGGGELLEAVCEVHGGQIQVK